MADKDYSQIDVNITTTFADGAQLCGTYTIVSDGERQTLTYSVERFAELTVYSPTPQKEQVRGSAVIENGNIVESTTADNKYVEFFQVSYANNHFDKSFFSDAVWTTNSLSATVSDPSSFFNISDFDASEMTIQVIFGSALQTMQLCYLTSDGTSVQVDYVFTE